MLSLAALPWVSKALRFSRGVLTFGVTIPVWAILAIALWVHVDKGSAVRAAIADLVAGAELEAAEARIAALEEINLEKDRQAVALTRANERFRQELEATELEMGNLDGKIADLLAEPVNDACVVDDALFERLRNP